MSETLAIETDLPVHTGESQIDSKEAKKLADKLRKRAKELVRDLEMGYLEMGKLLYRIWNDPKDGDPKLTAMFTDWGYTHFKDYVQEELGIQVRKAEHLRRIAKILEYDLSGLDPLVKERIVKLGWSKVRELVGVLTLTNAAKWADLAETQSYPTLLESVKAYKEDRENLKRISPAPKEFSSSSTPLDLPSADFAESPSSSSSSPSNNTPNYTSGTEAPSPAPAPPQEPAVPSATDKPQFKHFRLFDDQVKIVDAALNRAAQVAESDKTGHLLTLICTDFLATNDFLAGGTENFMKFMIKYEELLGLKLVAIDPKVNEVVFGLSALEALADKDD